MRRELQPHVGGVAVVPPLGLHQATEFVAGVLGGAHGGEVIGVGCDHRHHMELGGRAASGHLEGGVQGER